MDNKLIYGILMILVSVILVGSLLVPIIDNPAITKVKAINTNENAEYQLSDDFSTEVVIEISDGAITNGNQITPPNNPAINVFSDRFSGIWYKSQTAVDICDIDLGVVKNVTKIELHPDGSYEFTKSDSTVVNSTTPLTWIYYPSEDGDYGAFTMTAIVDNDNNWWATRTNIGASPWYYMILNLECDDEGITATQHYLAKTASDTFSEVPVTAEYNNYEPTQSIDGLTYIVSNPQIIRTATVDETDYEKTEALTPIIAPMEYHYYIDQPMEDSIYGIIPVVVIIAILLAAIKLFIVKRDY